MLEDFLNVFNMENASCQSHPACSMGQLLAVISDSSPSSPTIHPQSAHMGERLNRHVQHASFVRYSSARCDGHVHQRRQLGSTSALPACCPSPRDCQDYSTATSMSQLMMLMTLALTLAGSSTRSPQLQHPSVIASG